MSMQDPIADMLTGIRNAQASAKPFVEMRSSKQRAAIAKVLAEEGYIASYAVTEKEGWPRLCMQLKYYMDKPVVDMIKRVSRPGLRVYKSHDEIPKPAGGFGIAVISTSKGIMSSRSAKAQRLGGEVICIVS